jgi:hypothetical protein
MGIQWLIGIGFVNYLLKNPTLIKTVSIKPCTN